MLYDFQGWARNGQDLPGSLSWEDSDEQKQTQPVASWSLQAGGVDYHWDGRSLYHSKWDILRVPFIIAVGQ